MSSEFINENIKAATLNVMENSSAPVGELMQKFQELTAAIAMDIGWAANRQLSDISCVAINCLSNTDRNFTVNHLKAVSELGKYGDVYNSLEQYIEACIEGRRDQVKAAIEKEDQEFFKDIPLDLSKAYGNRKDNRHGVPAALYGFMLCAHKMAGRHMGGVTMLDAFSLMQRSLLRNADEREVSSHLDQVRAAATEIDQRGDQEGPLAIEMKAVRRKSVVRHMECA